MVSPLDSDQIKRRARELGSTPISVSFAPCSFSHRLLNFAHDSFLSCATRVCYMRTFKGQVPKFKDSAIVVRKVSWSCAIREKECIQEARWEMSWNKMLVEQKAFSLDISLSCDLLPDHAISWTRHYTWHSFHKRLNRSLSLFLCCSKHTWSAWKVELCPKTSVGPLGRESQK